MPNNLEPVAWFHVKRASYMTSAGRKRIASWLRTQANFLENEGSQFSNNFTARYLVSGKKAKKAAKKPAAKKVSKKTRRYN